MRVNLRADRPCPHKALRSRPSAFANLRFVERCLACEADFQRVAMSNRRLRRTSCLRIRPRGVMECRGVGVLRQIRIAPRDREVGGAPGE